MGGFSAPADTGEAEPDHIAITLRAAGSLVRTACAPSSSETSTACTSAGPSYIMKRYWQLAPAAYGLRPPVIETVVTPAANIPVLPGLVFDKTGSHIGIAGMAVLVELGVGVGEAERLGVDVWLAVKEMVGELEGVSLKDRPVTRITSPDAAAGAAPAVKASAKVKGYTGASKVMGSRELAGLAAPGTPLPGGLPATTPDQLVTAAPLRRRVAVAPASSVDVSTCTVTGLLLVKSNAQVAPAA